MREGGTGWVYFQGEAGGQGKASFEFTTRYSKLPYLGRRQTKPEMFSKGALLPLPCLPGGRMPNWSQNWFPQCKLSCSILALRILCHFNLHISISPTPQTIPKNPGRQARKVSRGKEKKKKTLKLGCGPGGMGGQLQASLLALTRVSVWKPGVWCIQSTATTSPFSQKSSTLTLRASVADTR